MLARDAVPQRGHGADGGRVHRLLAAAMRIDTVLGVALSLLALPAAAQGDPTARELPIRIALRARAGAAERITPLRYLGGFETKTLIYETLVFRGPDGRIMPGLATWQIGVDGTSFRFTVRPGATFQDGTPVTAEAIATHFRRWVGLPEHDWLLANRRIRDVAVESTETFVVHLDQPYPLLGDLAAINPCAITAPGARDWEGEWTAD
jgi:peptide/nickel transport system substrate-binding protein